MSSRKVEIDRQHGFFLERDGKILAYIAEDGLTHEEARQVIRYIDHHNSQPYVTANGWHITSHQSG